MALRDRPDAPPGTRRRPDRQSGHGRHGVLGVDGQDDAKQVVQRVPKAGVGQLVADPSTLGHGDDEPAASQTRQVVGQRLAGHAEVVREVGRVGRGLPEGQQHAGAGRVGQRRAEPGKDLAVLAHRQHSRTVQRGLYARVRVVGLNVGMRSAGEAGHPAPLRALTRWLVTLCALVAVIALHVLTAEDAPVLGDGATATATSSTGPATGWTSAVDPTDPITWAAAQIAPTVDGAAWGDAPAGALPDPWAAGCLLFLAALWVMAVLRRWIPLRPPTRSSWWPGAIAGPPLWPLSRLSLGVTRI